MQIRLTQFELNVVVILEFGCIGHEGCVLKFFVQQEIRG